MKKIFFCLALIALSFFCNGQESDTVFSKKNINSISVKDKLKDSILGIYYNEIDTIFNHVYFFDSLDLNYDNVKDLVITLDYTINSMWEVFYYDSIRLQYVKDTIISGSANPKFENESHFFYTFYHQRNLKGTAQSFKWNGRRWVLFKKFEVIPFLNNLKKYQVIYKNRSGQVMKEITINRFFNYPPTWLFR